MSQPDRKRHLASPSIVATRVLMRAFACVAAVCAAGLLASASVYADVSQPVVAPPPPTDIAPPAGPKFLWPAYKYPNIATPANAWSRAIATGAGQTFILNPSNGPGVANLAYQDAIRAARDAKIGLFGYVWTDYGKRPADQVMDDVKRWRTLYGITSIFLDEAASKLGTDEPGDTSLIDYYRQLHSSIRAGGGTVMLNPGVVPNQEYLTVAETIFVFEGSAATYGMAQFAQWTRAAANYKIAHIVYAATAAQEGALVRRAHTLGAGYISVTDDTLPNPYDSLPSCYLTERAQIRALA